MRKPVYTKNTGSRSVTTKSSTRRVTSSFSRAWRGMIMPMMKPPKMNAMLISSVM